MSSMEATVAGVQVSSLSPALTPHIKEENNIKQEEDELQVSVPEFSAVIVKTEESSLLQQTEQRDTQGEDIRADTHSETEGDTEHSSDTDGDDDWRAPLSCSHVPTESDGDESAPETSASMDNGDMTGTGEDSESRKHKCSVCKERFGSKYKLQIHRRVHTGEEPFSCPFCKKLCADSSSLKKHMRVHTGQKPFSCPVCNKVFAVKCDLKTHMRTHTGEKPFSCPVCNKMFAVRFNLKTHMRTHTGEKPFSCPVCKKVFAVRSSLKRHMRTHHRLDV